MHAVCKLYSFLIFNIIYACNNIVYNGLINIAKINIPPERRECV